MILRNFYDEKLAQASYLVGCAATGEAIVIDPLRDIQPYLDMATAQGLRITAVAETHIHADFLSGTRELSARTGALMYLSDEGDDLWKYAFAEDPKVVLMKHGHVIKVGNLTLKARHTPGHTPEHMAYILTDHPASDLPHSMFSGDFIFAGDVGRPDLLERAANFAGTMEAGARRLYQSVRDTDELPDSLLIWPGHGAGSACGKALGGSPVTSLGYERAVNWAFQISNENDFIREVLAGQPEPPIYFKEMKRLNKLGPAVLGSLPDVPAASSITGRLVDVRAAEEIRTGFIQGSLVLPSGKGLTNWAGWLLDYNQPITLVAENQEQANEAARDMATIGLDVVAGWVTPDEALPFQTVEKITCGEITASDMVLDIRGINEWNAGHMKGAVHIPLGILANQTCALPRSQRIVVHCAAGGRSPIGVSILLAAGFTRVAELPEGFSGIQQNCPNLIA